MKILIVGGAVRDLALDRTPHDIDYLVQGATVEEFQTEYPDAKQVGKSFPVFLVDNEEYAFARTETKQGKGHTGFNVISSPEVSIMEDLDRRDLTINAMAMCPETGKVIRTPEAERDLKQKILRHNSPAFEEDPLRVFRVARFASQLPDFKVAEETLCLMHTMKDDLYDLSAERVFQELEKALLTTHSHRFFEVLRDCGCLDTWFPEVHALIDVPAGPDTGKHAGEADTFDHTMKSMFRTPFLIPWERFAVLCHDFGKALSLEPPKHAGHDKAGVSLAEDLCERLRVPKVYRKAAVLFTEQHLRMHRLQEMRAGKAVTLIMKADKGMPGGLPAFLRCSQGDGMTSEEGLDIFHRAKRVVRTKLPEKHHGRGAVCAEVLMQLRCKAWKS